MTYSELLTRRSEILKRNIGRMIVRDNRNDLGDQEGYLMQRMIKELHQNEYELNATK
ncbi:hypothetical protein [Paenibacillus sp. 1P07SE]|uniref:hypothetical protein n=1 Tax=Paenibacillus sp. 1P07SE TaxID=3132209 RepID=UPI0039A45D4F